MSDFMIVAGKVYTTDTYHAALNTAILNRLEKTLPEGATLRRACKALSSLKTPSAHSAVMRDMIALLDASGADVPLKTALELGGGLPIAGIPNTV